VRRHSLHDHRLCVGPSIGLHSSAAGALLTSLLVHFLQSSARSPRHVSRRRTTSAAAGAMPSDASRGKERILGRGRRWGHAGLDDVDECPSVEVEQLPRLASLGDARVWRGSCPRGGVRRRGRARVRWREEGRGVGEKGSVTASLTRAARLSGKAR
jgi:hypothetical protein